MRARPYQRDGVLAVARQLREHDSTLIVWATGSGKTFGMALVGEMHRQRGGGRILITAPRDELISQAKKTLVGVIPSIREIDVGVEAGDRRAPAGTPYVVASLQSLHEERLERFRRDEFTLVQVDEAHLSATPTGVRVMDYFDGAKRVGWTATPDRLDGRPLVPDHFESIAHVYELPDAIEDGYLSPLRFKAVDAPIAFDHGVVAALDQGGNVAEALVEREMVREENLALAAAACRQLTEGKTLVFTVSVAHAHRLAERLGDDAAALDGDTSPSRRKAIMAAFRKGKIKYLCNCLLYTYGLDVPDLGTVVLARPTASRALYSQMVGRVARLYKGKEYGLVVDVVGMTGQHGLVTPSQALSQRHADLDALRNPEPIPMQEEESDDELLLDAIQLGLNVQEPEVTATDVDPELAIFGIEVAPRFEGDRNATAKQVEALENFGIDRAEELSMRQASAILDQLVQRANDGLCSLKMGRILARQGLNPNAPFEDAEWAIDRIRANRWRTPPDVLMRQSLLHSGKSALTLKEAP